MSFSAGRLRLGHRFYTKVAFRDVPEGTTCTLVEEYDGGYMVEWDRLEDLQRRQYRAPIIGPADRHLTGLRDGFSFDEIEESLVQIPSGSSAFKATKKPVAIEALEWTGTVSRFLELQKWTADSARTFVFDDENILIHTLEGTMKADVGDFIIKGVSGEFYPCKPSVFWKSYDVHMEPIEPVPDRAIECRNCGKSFLVTPSNDECPHCEAGA